MSNTSCIALGGQVIHSYGRLVHFEQVITRVEQLLPPGHVTGTGRLNCTRTKPEPAGIALSNIGIGTNPARNPIYRSIENDDQKDTIFIWESFLDNLRNAEGYCTNHYDNRFYLALSPGKCLEELVVQLQTQFYIHAYIYLIVYDSLTVTK